MEHTAPLPSQSEPPPPVALHPEILTAVLRIAQGPQQVKNKLRLILEYLTDLKQLYLSGRAAIFFADHTTCSLELFWSAGFADPAEIPCRKNTFGSCHCGRAIEDGKVLFTSEIPPLAEGIEVTAHGGVYCTPIIKDDQPLGIIVFYVQKEHHHCPETTSLFEAIGNIIAVIIENQQMDQQLIQLVNDLRGTIVNLREEKKFSESIIQGLNHGLIVVDLDGRIRKSNYMARQILKPFTNRLEGLYLADIFGADAAQRLLFTVPSGKQENDENELSLITPANEKKIIAFRNVCREDARGEKVGVIISLSDISELKYVRKEMEKMNRLSTVAEIASAVAHEVRNPLAGIKIMAQSIEEEARDNSEQLECSQRIIRQVDRLNQLLNDFFSYARPAEPNKRPTSLAGIIAETKPLINNRLIKNHIEVHEDIHPDLPMIIADSNQVQQVFLNLFLNSIDAIRAQGRIQIKARVLPPSQLRSYKKKYPALLQYGGYVAVDFSDNGKGMPAAVAEQVFEPFFTTKTSGAGLGLSIVYRTLKENDADIVLHSKEGKGTTFTIFFRTDL